MSLTDRALDFDITPFGKSDQEIQDEINEQRNLAEITGAAPKEYKYTEETLSKDPQWIESAKQVYELNEGAEAKGLESDERLVWLVLEDLLKALQQIQPF